MPAREEQETTITFGRIDDYAWIWTNNIVHIRTLEKEERAERTAPLGALTEEHIEAGFGAEYKVKAEDFNILGGFRRKRVMTDEQKAAAGERLRAARGKK